MKPIFRTRVLRRRPLLQLDFERMENRVLLAGDVSVFLQEGRLIVNGDGLANDVVIMGTASGGVVVTGRDSTTINGGNGAFSTGPVSGSTIGLLGGNDRLEIQGFVSGRGMLIDGGFGDDVIEVSHSRTGWFTVFGGDGHDSLTVDNVFSAIASNIHMQTGDDVVAIRSHASNGFLWLTTSSGDDTVVLGNTGMQGQLQLHTGNGNDRVLVAGTSWAGVNSGIRTGGGDDFVGVLPTQMGGVARWADHVTIDAGIGNDRVALGGNVRLPGMGRLEGSFGNDSLSNNAGVPGEAFIVSSFENTSVPNLNGLLDGLFQQLADRDIDPSFFGGPDLVRALALTTATDSVEFTENGSPVTVDSSLLLQGPSDAAITSATVAIEGFSQGNDALTFTAAGAISGSFDAGTGILSLNGAGTLSEWESVLRSVRFGNSSDNPDTATRTVRFTVNSASDSATATRTVRLTATPDGPELSVTTDAFTLDIDDPEVMRPLSLFTDLGLTDVDTPTFNMSDVLVAISAGRESGDVLSVSEEVGVTASYNAGTGVMSFTGTATLETLEKILRSVTFDNENAQAPLGTRTITVTVGDGELIANENVEVEVIASESPSVNVADSLLSFTETDEATPIDAALTIVPGSQGGTVKIDSARVAFTNGYVEGQDSLEFDAQAGITGTWDPQNGVLTLEGEADEVAYQALLRSVRFVNDTTGAGLQTGDRVVEFAIVTESGTYRDSRTVRVSEASDERLIQNYLADNDLTDVAQRTDSGLYYIVEQEGDGNFPDATSMVNVNYAGFLLDGTPFDSGQGVTFSLQGVIPGWTEGIPKFSTGGSGQLLIPAELAYGSASVGNIPPNSILRFEIDLLSFI